MNSERVEKIINSYPFFYDKTILKFLPDNKVEVSGICAWCCGHGSVDFGTCLPCNGKGWLIFEDEEDKVQQEVEVKVE